MLVYDISLLSPLGPRIGLLSLNREDSIVSGELSLFGKTEKIKGSIQNNSIKLSGNIETLLRKIPFEASGELSANNLKLQMHTSRGVFEIQGKRNKERERS